MRDKVTTYGSECPPSSRMVGVVTVMAEQSHTVVHDSQCTAVTRPSNYAAGLGGLGIITPPLDFPNPAPVLMLMVNRQRVKVRDSARAWMNTISFTTHTDPSQRRDHHRLVVQSALQSVLPVALIAAPASIALDPCPAIAAPLLSVPILGLSTAATLRALLVEAHGEMRPRSPNPTRATDRQRLHALRISAALELPARHVHAPGCTVAADKPGPRSRRRRRTRERGIDRRGDLRAELVVCPPRAIAEALAPLRLPHPVDEVRPGRIEDSGVLVLGHLGRLDRLVQQRH